MNIDSKGPNPPDERGPRKLWNMNFFLLWQGQFVSAVGDIVYAIALGFWVLALTGSTALMGTLMAASTLPRVLVAPFAGVIVDRSNRKWLLVLMDIIRGVAVVFIGVAAFQDFIQIWMVFLTGIIIGFCSAFFNPAVGSSLPDIVEKSKIIQANSVFSIIYTSSGIIGNSAGGFLFKILGAPLMFLFNGFSYLFSSLTLVFMRIPQIVHKTEQHFFEDMKEGFSFVWHVKGLRALIVMASVLNFFASMGIMLILPLFEQNEQLGPALYGFAMAFFTGGLFLGFLFASIFSFNPGKRFSVFALCCVLMSFCMIMFPVFLYFPIMAFFAFLAGFVNAILNALINGVTQLTVPQDKRGKVFGLMGSVAGGLTPIAFATGGILAEFIAVRVIISGSFVLTLFFFIPLFLSASFRSYINFDPDKETVEDLV